MRILVADDSTTMRNIVKKHLRKSGYGDHEVVEAGSGKEAHSMVLREEPDLMITDIDMPEMSGLELVKALRDQGVDVLFGVASAQINLDVAIEAAQLGARFVLRKPYDTDTFKRAIRPVIREMEARRETAAEHSRLENLITELRRENEALEARVEELEKAAPSPE